MKRAGQVNPIEVKSYFAARTLNGIFVRKCSINGDIVIVTNFGEPVIWRG